jgi:hypothetical protein
MFSTKKSRASVSAGKHIPQYNVSMKAGLMGADFGHTGSVFEDNIPRYTMGFG